MEFRQGTIEDLDHICCLMESAIKRMEAQGIHQWDEVYPSREDFVHDIINGILYTVTENNRLIAIYVISTEYDPQYSNGKWECDGETACIIHRLCVAPEVQNRGIGRKLLSHIEDQLRNKGFESVRLDVFSETILFVYKILPRTISFHKTKISFPSKTFQQFLLYDL